MSSIVVVACVMVASVLSTGLLVKVYREGGGPRLQGGTCQVVCGGASVAKVRS